MASKRGGKRAGAGMKPTKVTAFAPDQIIKALRARLDEKPPRMIGQAHARQILALIEAQRQALVSLIGAARHALPDVVNDDASVALEYQIEEAEALLREYRADEQPIII